MVPVEDIFLDVVAKLRVNGSTTHVDMTRKTGIVTVLLVQHDDKKDSQEKYILVRELACGCL